MSNSSPSRKRAAAGASATNTTSTKSSKTPVKSKTKKTQNVGDFYNMMLSKMEPGDECPLGLKAFAKLWNKTVVEENLNDKCWVCDPEEKDDGTWVYKYSLGPDDDEPAILTYEECKADWYNHVKAIGVKLGLVLTNATLLFNEGEMTRHQLKIEEEKNNHKGTQWWCMIDGVWTAYSKKTTHMMKPLSAQNKKKMPPVVPRGEQPHRTKVIGKGSIDISTLNVKIEKETGFQYIDISSADEEEEEEEMMDIDEDEDKEPQKKKAKTSGKGKAAAKTSVKGKGKGKAAAKTSPKKSGKEPAAETSPKKSGKEPAAATSPKKSGKQPAKTSGVADDEEPANEIYEAFMGNKSAVVNLFMETTGNEPTGTAKDIRKDLIDNHFSEEQLQQIGLGAGIANIKRVKKRATLVSKIMAELGNGKILPKPVSE